MLDITGLASLEPSELVAVAELHEKTARALRLKAAEKTAQIEQSIQVGHQLAEWRKRSARLAQIMIVKMEDGASPETAIRTTSVELGEGEKKLSYILRRYVSGMKSDARDKRRIFVVRLAQAGWSNQQIADHLDCHPNTVSRDIRRVLDPDR